MNVVFLTREEGLDNSRAGLGKQIFELLTMARMKGMGHGEHLPFRRTRLGSLLFGARNTPGTAGRRA